MVLSNPHLENSVNDCSSGANESNSSNLNLDDTQVDDANELIKSNENTSDSLKENCSPSSVTTISRDVYDFDDKLNANNKRLTLISESTIEIESNGKNEKIFQEFIIDGFSILAFSSMSALLSHTRDSKKIKLDSHNSHDNTVPERLSRRPFLKRRHTKKRSISLENFLQVEAEARETWENIPESNIEHINEDFEKISHQNSQNIKQSYPEETLNIMSVDKLVEVKHNYSQNYISSTATSPSRSSNEPSSTISDRPVSTGSNNSSMTLKKSSPFNNPMLSSNLEITRSPSPSNMCLKETMPSSLPQFSGTSQTEVSDIKSIFKGNSSWTTSNPVFRPPLPTDLHSSLPMLRPPPAHFPFISTHNTINMRPGDSSCHLDSKGFYFKPPDPANFDRIKKEEFCFNQRSFNQYANVKTLEPTSHDMLPINLSCNKKPRISPQKKSQIENCKAKHLMENNLSRSHGTPTSKLSDQSRVFLRPISLSNQLTTNMPQKARVGRPTKIQTANNLKYFTPFTSRERPTCPVPVLSLSQPLFPTPSARTISKGKISWADAHVRAAWYIFHQHEMMSPNSGILMGQFGPGFPVRNRAHKMLMKPIEMRQSQLNNFNRKQVLNHVSPQTPIDFNQFPSSEQNFPTSGGGFRFRQPEISNHLPLDTPRSSSLEPPKSLLIENSYLTNPEKWKEQTDGIFQMMYYYLSHAQKQDSTPLAFTTANQNVSPSLHERTQPGTHDRAPVNVNMDYLKIAFAAMSAYASSNHHRPPFNPSFDPSASTSSNNSYFAPYQNPSDQNSSLYQGARYFPQ